jgi:hypothetical protein
MKLSINTLSLAAFALSALALWWFAVPSAWSEPADPTASIQQHIEKQLFTLPPGKQEFYGIRMYRITGDDRYLYASLYGAYATANRLDKLVLQMQDQQAVALFLQEAKERRSSAKAERQRAKAELYEECSSAVIYAKRLVHDMKRLDAFGLESVHHETLVQHFRSLEFSECLLKKEVIRVWAAQAANYVYWLQQLGVVDLTERFREAFQAAFPDPEDSELEDWQYINKIYGMTHIIIAASEYYQRVLDPEEVRWILVYFSEHLTAILRRTTTDVIAEVGISFLLAGETRHPVVQQCKETVARAVDPQHGIIPSVGGSFDLAKAEHSNVVALILFNWPSRLHTGPHLADAQNLRARLPCLIEPK